MLSCPTTTALNKPRILPVSSSSSAAFSSLLPSGLRERVFLPRFKLSTFFAKIWRGIKVVATCFGENHSWKLEAGTLVVESLSPREMFNELYIDGVKAFSGS